MNGQSLRSESFGIVKCEEHRSGLSYDALIAILVVLYGLGGFVCGAFWGKHVWKWWLAPIRERWQQSFLQRDGWGRLGR